MDFELIDKTADTQFKELERRIWRLQSGGTIDSLKTIGAETSHQIGASFVSLKQLATRYTMEYRKTRTTNHSLFSFTHGHK